MLKFQICQILEISARVKRSLLSCTVTHNFFFGCLGKDFGMQGNSYAGCINLFCEMKPIFCLSLFWVGFLSFVPSIRPMALLTDNFRAYKIEDVASVRAGFAVQGKLGGEWRLGKVC